MTDAEIKVAAEKLLRHFGHTDSGQPQESLREFLGCTWDEMKKVLAYAAKRGWVETQVPDTFDASRYFVMTEAGRNAAVSLPYPI